LVLGCDISDDLLEVGCSRPAFAATALELHDVGAHETGVRSLRLGQGANARLKPLLNELGHLQLGLYPLERPISEQPP